MYPLAAAFDWESSKQGNWYKVIQNHIPVFKKMGATHIWLPSPCESVSPEGYLPKQYYKLDTAYGDAASLIETNIALLQNGLHPIADIVINHRSADEKDSNGIWNQFRDDVPHPGESVAWGSWAITCNDPDFDGSGSSDSGSDFGPSPDIDHKNPVVQQGIIDWLSWLKTNVGFEGWRLDFAKGYGPEYAKLYIEKTLEAGKDFCVGEYWVDAAW